VLHNYKYSTLAQTIQLHNQPIETIPIILPKELHTHKKIEAINPTCGINLVILFVVVGGAVII